MSNWDQPIVSLSDYLLYSEYIEGNIMAKTHALGGNWDNWNDEDDSFFEHGDNLGNAPVDLSAFMLDEVKPDKTKDPNYDSSLDSDFSNLALAETLKLRDVIIDPFTDWNNTDSVLAASEIAVDIETTGLDPRFRIRLMQIYLPHLDQVAILDLWDLTTPQTKWLNAFLVALANPKIKKYLQNGLFDLYWILYKFRVLGRNIIDSRILSQIAKAGQYDGYKFEAGIDTPNSLEYLSLEFGFEHDKTLQKSKWDGELTEDQIAYAARDPIVTYRIGRTLYERLIVEQPMTVQAELGSIPYFVYSQYVGLPADINYLFQMCAKYSGVASQLQEKLGKLMGYDPAHRAKIDRQMATDPSVCYGKKGQLLAAWKDKPFNINSPSQIVAYLKKTGLGDFLKVTDKKTGEEKESTSKKILFEIASELKTHSRENIAKINHTILDLFASDDFDESTLNVIDLLIEVIYFRSIQKAASTLDSYYTSFCPMRKSIQVSYNVLATQGMGRSSSGGQASKDWQNSEVEPLKIQNAQNWSKHLPSHQKYGLPPIRSIVQAREGYTLCEIDLAASHIQFARFLSKDESLQESHDSGIKIHYYTLSSVLEFEGMSVTPAECIDLVTGKVDSKNKDRYKYLYKLVKQVIYCFLNYGGAATLQGEFFKYEMFVPLRDCRKYLDAAATRYFQLRSFQERVHRTALNRIDSLYAPTGEYLGKFGYSITCDNSVVWHRAKWTDNGHLDIKISDVVSAQWLRPEATVYKLSLREILDLCIDVWGLNTVVRPITFTHDSCMLEIKDEHVHEILPVCFDIVNKNMSNLITDYKPEGDYTECILGKYWEKP